MDHNREIVDGTELHGIGVYGDAFEFPYTLLFEYSFTVQPADEILRTQSDQTLGPIIKWLVLF